MMNSRSVSRPSTPLSPSVVPTALRTRRGSWASVTSRSNIDKDVISHVLDDIHFSASQSSALTTFNDFGPPPTASSSADDRSSAGQLVQQSIGNIYARLRGAKSPQSQKQLSEAAPSLADVDRAKPEPNEVKLEANNKEASRNLVTSSSPSNRSEVELLSQVSDDRKSASSKSTKHRDDPSLKSRHDVSQLAIPRKSQEKSEYEGSHPVSHASTTKSSPVAIVSSSRRSKSTSRDSHDASFTMANLPDMIPVVESGPAVMLGVDQKFDAESPAKSRLGLPLSPIMDDHLIGLNAGHSQVRSGSDQLTLSANQSRSIASSASGRQSPALSSLSGHVSALDTRPDNPQKYQSQPSGMLNEMRRKVLSRDFWMKDENAKVCFRCGDPFSTFRRKHHCRTCGQIYDAKCTVLTSGKPFGQASKLRVCKGCEAILNGDDSSDYSEDDGASIHHVKQIRFSEGLEQIRPSTPATGPGVGVLKKVQDLKRRPGSSDLTPALARPSSSRSLKSLTSRPRSSSHRHRRIMQQHIRSLGVSSESGMPFQPSGAGNSTLHSIHADSIIDPELAPYMSDEGSSDDEMPSIASQFGSPAQEITPGGFASLMGHTRRAKHKPSRSLLDGNQGSRDAESSSFINSKVGHVRRQIGSRTFSSGSLVGMHGTSPRVIRSQNLMTDYGSHVSMLRRASVPDADALLATSETHTPTDFALDDQSGKPVPAAELNNASLDHVKLLLRQFLTDNQVDSARRWEKVLIPILLRCAEEVDPNINRGDDIDIRHYVKLKKAPGGSPNDSAYISGVIFTKNLALRGMPRVINNPRILLVSFPIVYDRHQQHFMSLEPVIAQEKEYLRNLTNRIKALKPSVVLVQRQVAGLAIEFLNEARIAVASNVKESVLQAISRCTQTRIISSVDRLTMNPDHLGHCQKFEVRTFLEQNMKKSYIFVAGCQRDLGCTILLRGADKNTLRSLKWITEFMCFVVYNLKLETCLMRDEFVAIPSTRSAYQDALDQGAETAMEGKAFCEALVSELKTRILSVSPFVKLDEPYLLLRGSEQEQLLQRLQTLLEEKPDNVDDETDQSVSRFEMIKHEMLFGATSNTSPQLQAAIRAIHEAEFDRASHHYQALKRRWEAYVAGAVEPFSPLSHQQIVVLFSIVSTPSGDACEGPDLLGLDFYQEHDIENHLEPDVPLGEYIERLCHQADFPCTAQRCDRSMLEHHRQYVHGDGQISIYLQKTLSKIRGMENTILMWSTCRKCDEETQVVPMSADTWKYSFGKYLELSFWSEPMHARAGSCPHDVHKDHARYFGFKDMAVCLLYEPINIMEILVPRATVAWKVDKDISLKNDQYERIESRMSQFLSSVKARIRSIKIESVEPEKAESCKVEIANMMKRVGDEQDLLKRKLEDKYMTSKHYEIIPMNRAVRALQEKVADWDATFADFERNYFPSETDIRKLAAQQLRKVYLEAQGALEHNEDSDGLPDDDDNQENSLTEKNPTFPDPGAETTPLPVDTTPGTALSAALSIQANYDALNSKDQQQRDLDTVQRLDLAIPKESMNQIASNPAEMTAPHQQSPGTTSNLSRAAPVDTSVVWEGPNPESSSPGQQRKKFAANSREVDSSANTVLSPPLLRSQTSPPSQTSHIQSDVGGSEAAIVPLADDPSARLKGAATNFGLDKQKTSSRLAMAAALRTGKSAMQSMIPRSIPSKSNYTKVSALAKHFEQMSREFEKERLRERKQRAARNVQARVYPMSSYRPIVEVFRDATEAVRERDASLDDHPGDSESVPNTLNDEGNSESVSPETSMRNSLDHSHELGHSVEATLAPSYETSEAEVNVSEPEASISGGTLVEDKLDLDDSSISEQFDLPMDLPKHDRSSLMKMLTSFWSERSASGWNALDYPLRASDHIFADSDIVVREDEPSSLVAFALASQDYGTKLQRFRERAREEEAQRRESHGMDPAGDDKDIDVERTLLGKTATHMKYQFQAESARMQCKIFYAESFDAIRRKCGVEDRFVESLSRCAKWDSKGGKSKSLFLKTLDERFVIKSLSPVETQAFLKFAPDYFDFMSKCLFHNLPSCLAKMLGCYQVVIKNPLTGIEFSYFLQVMENVFYENPSNRLFDLKGSMRNRRIESTGEKDEVLLDENMLDYISQSPIYVRNHSNSLLASSITNDTLFCSKQNVMDYSLIVGLYDDRKELMVGIIDYIRTYTWDKKLESWIKDRGKHKPTVRSPREYRNRFRASIPKYFPLAPSSWQVFGGSQALLVSTPMPLLAEQEQGDASTADGIGDEGDGDGNDNDSDSN